MTDELKNIHIGSLFGAKTKQGIVELIIDGHKTQLSILAAKKVGYMILEAAFYAQVDESVYGFFSKLPGEGKDSMILAATVLQAIRENQGRNDPRFFED